MQNCIKSVLSLWMILFLYQSHRSYAGNTIDSSYAKFNEKDKRFNAPFSCDIRGAETVSQGATNQRYDLDCDGGLQATSWEVTCGTITSWGSDVVRITWNNPGCVTATITAKNGGSVITTRTVTFYYGVLTGGSITSSNQTIAYNTAPATINATAATGGTCGLIFTYRWQSSTNGSSWTDISGTPAAGQNYSPGALTSSRYFRRKTTCNGSTVYTSNSRLVTVMPELQGGTASPGSSTINYNTSPGLLSGTLPTGGNCGSSYAYTWQSSSDAVNWGDVSGANSQHYTPGNLTSSTYFRRKTVCSAETAYTNSISVTVRPELIAGTASVASTTIGYNTSPRQISADASAGGGCSGSYIYQWEYSQDGTNWSNISGATSQHYTPGLLTTNSSYRRKTVCGTETVYTNVISITISLELSGGEISPYDLTITYNTSPGQITGTNASNGSCGSYEYKWQFSTDGSSWSYIPTAESQHYTPGDLMQTTYFRREVVCGAETEYSNVAIITVTPQLTSGSITTSDATINFNTSPGELITTAASGGNCENYVYQWQHSTNGSEWTGISGATSQNYTPGILTVTTYYRRSVVCSTETFYTNIVTVTVNGMLLPGNIGSGSYTVESGSGPGLLTASVATGGGCNGIYNYRWQFSGNGVYFGDVADPEGEALTYNPGNLTAKRFFRRRVVCNGDTSFTDIIIVNIGAVSTIDHLNYIIDRTFVRPGITDVATADTSSDPLNTRKSTQYFDGLGRLIQTVNQKASPDHKDLVMPVAYDMLGREAFKFMPYVSASDNGLYKANPLNEQTAFNEAMFPGEQYYYGHVQYEASPLSRILSTTAPGINWAGSSRGVQQEYLTNSGNDSVRIWNIAPEAGGIPSSSTTYEAGQLYKNATRDEHGKQTIEFSDKAGRIVLKKVQLADQPGTAHQGWLCTYYIYDNYSNLRFVLTPKAVELVNNNWIISLAIADGLCFQYAYDKRNRMINKKVPGSGTVEMVYDARDRLIMTRDSVQRAQDIWLYNRYDDLNRPVLTGKWENGNDRIYHQSLADESISYPQPSGTWEVLTETYYDDYNWVSSSGSGLADELDDTHITSSNFFTTYNISPEFAQAITQTKFPRNLVTGSKVKVLGTTSFLYTVMFYDDRERLVQSQSTNINTGKEITTTQYSFDGKPLRTLVYHQKDDTPSQQFTVLTKMNYDAHGRVIGTTKNINDTGDKPVSEQSYNALGILEKKIVGPVGGANGNALDSLKYDYNVRGWMKSINADYISGTGTNYFGMELVYDNPGSATGTNFAAALYNGNVAGTSWKSRGNGINRKYEFNYDNVNRLTGAAFLQYSEGTWNNAKVNFSVSGISYDANGNILTMNQDGLKLNTSERIDSLIYTYYESSNRLKNVIDIKNDTATLLGDFRSSELYMTSLGNNKTNNAVDYVYDANGNLIKDRNKNIGDGSSNGITYNYLNLPQTITVRDETGIKGTINYVYDASGTKLSKVVTDDTNVTTTLYHGIFQYINDTLQFVVHEEGRIRPDTMMPNPDGFYYDYFIKDHLGNVRMVLTEEAKIDDYPAASMETASRSVETLYYGGLDETEVNKPEGFDTDINNQKVSMLNYSDPARRIGPNALLRVMATDTVDISVLPFYKSTGQNNNNSSIPEQIITALISSFGGGSGATAPGGHFTIGERNAVTFTEGIYPGIAGLKDNDPYMNAGRPKAYLNWILFDEQFNLVSGSSGTGQVHLDADVSPVGNPLAFTNMIMNANGYLYVYVSNESPMNVYFDDFKVKHKKGRIVEENHYYPFGLTMAGISSNAIGGLDNKGEKFQSQPFDDDLGLNWYGFKWRNHDPQIGRFIQIDPLSEKYVHNSTYAFSENKVTNHVELEGLESVSANVASHYKEYMSRIGVNFSGSSSNGMVNNPLITHNRISKLERGASENRAGVVLHRTVSSSGNSTLSSFKTGVGTHFLVDKDGTIYQTASLDKKTSHLRESQLTNPDLSNANTIGIEVVGMPLDKDGKTTLISRDVVSWEPLTDNQTSSVGFLINSLMETYGLSSDQIFNHEDIQPKTAGEGGTVREAVNSLIDHEKNKPKIFPTRN